MVSRVEKGGNKLKKPEPQQQEPNPATKADFLRLARMVASGGTIAQLEHIPIRTREYELKNGMRIAVMAVPEDAVDALRQNDPLCQVVVAQVVRSALFARTVGLLKDGTVVCGDDKIPANTDLAQIKTLVAKTYQGYLADEDTLLAAITGLRATMLFG